MQGLITKFLFLSLQAVLSAYAIAPVQAFRGSGIPLHRVGINNKLRKQSPAHRTLGLRGGWNFAMSASNDNATILLIRHGQTEWNVQGRYQGQKDSPLTPLGRQEAIALGERLRQGAREINPIIWSSDLNRAVSTAEEVVAALRLSSRGLAGVKYEIKTDPRLRERSFGILEGMTREECRSKHAEEMRKFSADGDYAISGGGESRSALVERTEAVLVDIAKQNLGPQFTCFTGQTCVVVTHGAVVSSWMRYLLGISFNVTPTSQPKGDLQIRNTCICEIRYLAADARWLVLSVGDVAHTEQLRNNEALKKEKEAKEVSLEQA